MLKMSLSHMYDISDCGSEAVGVQQERRTVQVTRNKALTSTPSGSMTSQKPQDLEFGSAKGGLVMRS